MKKGFTLIELLAVIIVLAVIALIATPIVLDVIDSAKLKAFEESAYGIMETVKLKNYDSMLEKNDKIYVFPNDELVFQGERPKGGTIISQNGNTAIAIHNNKWCAKKGIMDDKVEITDYDGNCDLKLVNLNGAITGIEYDFTKENYEQSGPINGMVRLIKDNKIVYETTSNSEGKYEFTDVVADQYILLVSENDKTKYGEEIVLNENTTKDIEASLYYGDFDNNGVISSEFDRNELKMCYLKESDKCLKYDFNNDGLVNFLDNNAFSTYVKFNSSYIKVLNNDSITIKGSIKVDNVTDFQMTLYNLDNNYKVDVNADNSFILENIPKGYYRLRFTKITNKLTKTGNNVFETFRYFNSDIDNLIIDLTSLYKYDLDEDKYLDERDITNLKDAIDYIDSGGEHDESDIEYYDLNSDGVVDDKDVSFLISIINQYKQQMKSDLSF